MARRSLKPQLNQIRAWVRQGRTDAWIAHQLEVSAAELREFRDQHDLTADGEDAATQDVDLRDEIEAEVEAATAEEAAREEEEAAQQKGTEEEAESGDADGAKEEGPGDEEGEGAGDEEGARGEEGADATGSRPRRRRRRGRRGGRGRRKDLEGRFDHGEQDGYGLWLDPTVKDNPIYVEHWAGKREVSVRIEPDQIVIRRAGEPEQDEPGSGDPPEDSDD
ncbi:MAG: hypothetical protein WBM00_01725 [Solirubrobacterales bacterium]